MANLIFSNSSSGNSALYTTTDDNGWCSYLLAKGVVGPTDGNIKLSDIANYNGYLLFATAAPTIGISTFVSNLYTFLGPPIQYQSAALVWLMAPNDAFSNANVLQLILTGASEGYSVLQPMNFNFGNDYSTLYISQNNTTVTIDTTNNIINLVEPQGSANFTYRPNDSSLSSEIMSGLEIPLTGIGRGRIRFTFGFNHSSDFKAFDISSKYFFTNESTTDLTEISYSLVIAGNLNELVQAQASIYPCDLLNTTGTNTYFALLGKTYNTNTKQTTPTLLCSYYLTNFGYPINIVPHTDFTTVGTSKNYPTENSALFVLSERTVHSDDDRWYMVPQGGFPLTLSDTYKTNVDANGQMQLMCGLASTEGISFTPQFVNTGNVITGTGDWLFYTPNQSAYAPQFPIAATKNVVGSNTSQQWLQNTYLTAWVGIVKAATTEVVYHAQAQGSSLFAQSSDESSPLFNHFTTGSGVLSMAKETIIFPLAPYGNATANPATGVDISLFEKQILNPARKATISNIISSEKIPVSPPITTGLSAAATSGIPSTSPQGFYINVNQQTGVWDTLKLASNQFLTSEGTLSDVYNLEFCNVTTTLQSALQSNQLFLVVSYNKTLDGSPTVVVDCKDKTSTEVPNTVLGKFCNEMEIEEWPFNLDVPTEPVNGKYNNVIIFKFCHGALIDRVQNIQSWNSPDDFNDTTNNGLPNLSMWLQDYIQKGMDKYTVQGDKDYLKFYDIATNSNWQGIIALGVDISVQDFPPELQGLLAGIDLNRFYAHHFGVDISIVNNDSGTVAMQPTSSLFGLIDYEDQTFESLGSNPTTYQEQAPINTSVDYDFTVLKLKVVFVNSKIYNYNSYLALTVNKLFGEQVDATNRENLLILTGTYENHNGVPSYTFVNTADSVLKLTNTNIITDIEIIKSTFVTIVPQDGTTSNIVQSQFAFWGFINYNNLEGFDLFSFGAEGTAPVNYNGLSYSNLYIDLSFPLDTPTTKTFTFDISHMAFDIGQSTPREDSLYSHFPLQLKSITTGDANNTPKSQGYLDVAIPSLQQQQGISGEWYGLEFSLNMGTLGSLASSAGFTSTFLMAWGVGATGAWAGVQLPGVNPQAPSFSLQGVLKLDIGAIQLEKATGTTGTAYLMKINNIALKLFSLSFPPGGNISFMLFGNPAADAKPESLGWYGAYVKS